jgi:O-antigen/teichoic acid export membrane protein
MLKQSAGYLAASVANRAVPFLLLPLLTRALSPAEFGFAALFQALVSFAVPVVGLMLPAVVGREYYGRSAAERAVLAGNLVVLLAGAGAAATLVLLAGVWAVGMPAFAVPLGWLLAVPAVAAANTVLSIQLAFLRNEERVGAYGFYAVGATLVGLGLSVVLVVTFGLGWQGRAWAILITALLFAALGVASLVREGKLVVRVERRAVAAILRFALPLVPHGLGSVAITFADRFVVDGVLGKDAVGLYSVAYSFGMAGNLAVEALNGAWSPLMFRALAEKTGARAVVRSTVSFVAAVLAGTGLIGVAAFVAFPYVTGPAFHSAHALMPWIALGYGFYGVYTGAHVFLAFAGRTGMLSLITTLAAAANVGATWALVRYEGLMGAAHATALAYALMMVLAWGYAARVHPLPWSALFRRQAP